MTKALEVRDAGPLDLEDQVIAFEAEIDEALGAQACIVSGNYVSIVITYSGTCAVDS